MDRATTVRPGSPRPFFSICIPQYNRTDFLIKSCETFRSQSFRDFEICISDDRSTDGREADLVGFLERAALAFTYEKNERNLRYDANLRHAIALSRGQFVLLMGNDDGLAGDDILAFLHAELLRHAPVAAAITNYRDAATGKVYRRMDRTAVLGSGPRVATLAFRRYSFVSGVIFDGERARAEADACVDGSEMYQMYLGTRLVSAGGRLLAIDRICIDMGLQVPDQAVDSYARWERIDPCPIVERPLPMGRLLEVVAKGLGPARRQADILGAAAQLYLFTYPFWVLEYRRVQSWNYAAGMLLALRPSRIARDFPVSVANAMALWALYVVSSVASLLFPARLFAVLQPSFYALAKRMRVRSEKK